MNLQEVREQVVKSSGRYDLVIDAINYADNGMDYYINAGMSFLDKFVDIPDSFARLFYKPVAGSYSVTVPSSCRALYDVWVSDSESRWKLTKVTPTELFETYASPVSTVTPGTPTCYAFIDMRSLAPDYQNALAEFIDKVAVDGSGHGTRGIVFAPQTDKPYVIEVNGLFKQVTLTDDEDTNFWTYKEPDLLVRSALYKLEAHSRGTENAKNWLSAIADDVRLLDLDVVAEESYGIDQLKG